MILSLWILAGAVGIGFIVWWFVERFDAVWEVLGDE